MYASRADLSQAFCSYCGYPPMGRWRSLAHRVCIRCQMGTVLRAPPGLAPRFDEPFVIVDSDLRLQAVSHHAEVMLAVDEPAAVDLPLEEFLVCRKPGNIYSEHPRRCGRTVVLADADGANPLRRRATCCEPSRAIVYGGRSSRDHLIRVMLTENGVRAWARGVVRRHACGSEVP